jgi:SAM-dependent MidA family methyltransferase
MLVESAMKLLGDEEMGKKFKVLAIAHPTVQLPAFDSAY